MTGPFRPLRPLFRLTLHFFLSKDEINFFFINYLVILHHFSRRPGPHYNLVSANLPQHHAQLSVTLVPIPRHTLGFWALKYVTLSIWISFLCWLNSFLGTKFENQTQGFVHARKILCHWVIPQPLSALHEVRAHTVAQVGFELLAILFPVRWRLRLLVWDNIPHYLIDSCFPNTMSLYICQYYFSS